MATIEDLELQVQKLKKKVRQLTPKANEDGGNATRGDRERSDAQIMSNVDLSRPPQ